jgi:CubicO group peptidase (beta-lactamase class C family)
MKSRIAVVLLGFSLSSAAAASQDKADVIARVENSLMAPVTLIGQPTAIGSIEQRMAHHKVPALSVAVVEDGKLVWAKAYGEAVAGGRPASTATLFQAASISKPVAAAAALTLVHRGRLSLDKPVNEYLSSWKLPESEFTARQPVTLRHLLSHSGGTTVSGFPGYAAGDRLPLLRQVLSGAAPANTKPILVDRLPGEAWRYSGGGTSVMQQMVEDVTRLPFASFMRETMLRPLGMSRSGYEQPLPQERQSQAAVAHDGGGAPLKGKWHTYPEQAAAGLWTTPTDLARFVTWVMKGLNDKSVSAEHKAVAAYLTQPQASLSPAPNQRMGLGFFLPGEGKARAFSHSGSNEGFRAYMIGYPETGQGAVIMTNSDNGVPLAQELLRSIALEYGWPERQHRFIPAVQLSSDQLKKLAGTYRWGDTPGQQAIVSEGGGGLQVQLGQRVVALHPEDAGSFVRADTGSRVRFADDTMIVEGGGPPLTAKRVKP